MIIWYVRILSWLKILFVEFTLILNWKLCLMMIMQLKIYPFLYELNIFFLLSNIDFWSVLVHKILVCASVFKKFISSQPELGCLLNFIFLKLMRQHWLFNLIFKSFYFIVPILDIQVLLRWIFHIILICIIIAWILNFHHCL